jgi:flavin reductase (DIM6/NTAB) family NADH-FMN oxidoreductase RutF
MRLIDPKEIPTRDLHQFIIGSVSPRPIAFASTMSADGQPNLAPYSFFNAFSSNPPTLIFSANRRVRGNTTKDTLHNVEATGEVVINIVHYDMVRQMSLASVEYPADVNEFEKAGLTPVPSKLVKPFRVKESHVHYECKVQDIISLGEHGGAGNLIICEVLLMHVAESIIDENGRIDPHKADNVGRMGRSYYSRASGEAVFTVVQEVLKMAIGFDGLPPSVRNSRILTGNELAMLAGVQALPSDAEIDSVRTDPRVMDILAGNAQDRERQQHLYAKELLEREEVEKAWKVLLV